MKRKNRTLFFNISLQLFFFFILPLRTYAQNELIQIQQLSNQPQNDVNCIYRDKNGYMWIGTLDGLHKYDGYTYKSYKVQPDGSGISSNLIKEIDEDSQGNIWIGTYDKGICKLNPQTETFTNFYNTPSKGIFNSNDVTTLIVDNKNIIWTGNMNGINRIQMDSTMTKINKVDIFNTHEFDISINSNQVKVIFQDKSDNIWVGTNLNLFHLLDPYTSSTSLSIASYNISVESICEYEEGIFIGGYDKIYQLQTNSKPFTLKAINNKKGTAISYSNNKLWIGNREGLFTLTHTENTEWDITHHFYENFEDNSLSCNLVSCINYDINEQIWIGTRGGGINIAQLKQKRFEHYKKTLTPGSIKNNLCRYIFEDSYQNLWIGTEEQGINFLPKNANYANGFIKLNVNTVTNLNRAYCIEETILPNSKKHKSLVWVGTSYPTNLSVYNPVTLEQLPTHPQFINIGFVFALESQNDSIMWVGTYGSGLYRFTLDDDGNVLKTQNFSPNDDSPNSISSIIVRSIFKDSNGNIWVGTDKGLNFLSKKESLSESPKFKVYSSKDNTNKIPHDYILQIFEAKNKTIWIGTMGGGLLKYTTPLGDKPANFIQYTTENNLPNNTIKSINEDSEGNLWLTSNNGLSKFDPNKEIFNNYDISDGLQDNEFSEICSVTRKNGQIVVGGIRGFNVFYPGDIKPDIDPPIMHLTNFYIDNIEIKPNSNDGILKKDIQYTKELTLKFQDNSFSIGFVGLNYNAPQKNNYQYILEGFDKQWYRADAKYRIAKYTNIPPGTYEFRVIGSNSDNVWSTEPAKLKIVIKPPFYRSNLAYILYFLAILGILFLLRFLSYQKHNHENELLRAKLERDKVEELSQLKLRFFTNISHEFRTPLTLISAPLTRLIKENDGSSANQRLTLYKLIDQNIKIMMRLINQLMDFRKLEQDKMSLKVNKFNLVEFTYTFFNSFSELAYQKKIDYDFTCNERNIEIWGDQEKIERVIYNIIANAFKYTPSNGSINVELIKNDEDQTVEIRVSDTGIGIKEEAKAHIFERYFRDKSQLQQDVGGTGIGLALSLSLIELHHGTITFESKENKGSTFSIIIPLGNTHFKEEEIDNNYAEYQFTSTSTGANKLPDPDMNQSTPIPYRKRILVVEDNHDLRIFITNSLTDDFDVIQVEDGKQAIDSFTENIPDLIVSDIMMPNINGIELCEYVKTHIETSHIPVILLTAKNTDESQIEGYETGADGYLNKPFNIDVLKASINSLIKNREELKRKFQKEETISPDIIANNSTDAKFLDKILSIIDENISDSEFSVETLADKYGVSRIYLNRKIKALTGETSNQFIRNIRLKHAAKLLKNGEMNVSEVTWMVGYNDLKTFRVRFKEKFGLSPSDYAQKHKA